jgi:hypothetical protein
MRSCAGGGVALKPSGDLPPTYFKLRRKNAFGRDSQAGVQSDQEHYGWCLLTRSAYDKCLPTAQRRAELSLIVKPPERLR